MQAIEEICDKIVETRQKQRQEVCSQIRENITNYGCHICRSKVSVEDEDINEYTVPEAGVPEYYRNVYNIPEPVDRNNIVESLQGLDEYYENIELNGDEDFIIAQLKEEVILCNINLGRFKVYIPISGYSRGQILVESLDEIREYIGIEPRGKCHPGICDSDTRLSRGRIYSAQYNGQLEATARKNDYKGSFFTIRSILTDESLRRPHRMESWLGARCPQCTERYKENIRQCSYCGEIVCENCREVCIQENGGIGWGHSNCISLCNLCGKKRLKRDIYPYGDCINCRNQNAKPYSSHYDYNKRRALNVP